MGFLLAFAALDAQFQPGKIFVKIKSDDNNAGIFEHPR